jgi:hypothetical protein
MPALFDPLRLGPLALPNRILMATHYAQRASAGLIVAEATMVTAGNAAFPGAPGVHSAAHVAGWKLVTDAVHAAGGRIFLQLWHGGRACHPALNGGATSVAPSPIAIAGETYTTDGMKPHVTPHELRNDELPGVVEAFRTAARNAKAAGFDGVEIHGANGYLLDEFLRDGSNRRGDARFCLTDRRSPEIRSGARQARRRDDAVSAAIQRVEADAASRDAGRIEARRIRQTESSLRKPISASAARALRAPARSSRRNARDRSARCRG